MSSRYVLAWMLLGAGIFSRPAAPATGPPAPGSQAPGFVLSDLHGVEVSLSSFRGRLVLLHFWATWCPTCREEMGLLEETARAHRGPLAILGVNLGEKRRKVEAYAKERGITFPILLDVRGKVAARYGVLSLPATLVVAPDGRIADRVVMGSLDRQRIDEILARHGGG